MYGVTPNQMTRSIKLCNWNVRGLNDSVKCGSVLAEMLSASPDIVLLQESKLHDVPLTKRLSILPWCLDEITSSPPLALLDALLLLGMALFCVPLPLTPPHTPSPLLLHLLPAAPPSLTLMSTLLPAPKAGLTSWTSSDLSPPILTFLGCSLVIST